MIDNPIPNPIHQTGLKSGLSKPNITLQMRISALKSFVITSMSLLGKVNLPGSENKFQAKLVRCK
jgi:hypothetical protein